MLKKLLITLLVTLLCGGVALAAGHRDITSREAKTMLGKNPNIYLLDVRTPREYRQMRIPGSTLIPINEFQRRSREIPRNKPIIVLCAVGGRSPSVAQYLANQGIKEVYNMTDGIVGWNNNGFQVLR